MEAVLFGLLVAGVIRGLWWIVEDCLADRRWWKEHDARWAEREQQWNLAPVAQGTERLASNERVGGSNPSGSAMAEVHGCPTCYRDSDPVDDETFVCPMGHRWRYFSGGPREVGPD